MADHTHAELQWDHQRANVTFRTEGGINVGSIEFMRELEEVVDQLAQDRSARYAVFRGEGKAFLAGANIKAMVGYSMAEARAMAELGHRVFDKIQALPKLTIAAIGGACLGGGCELVMACDLRVAVKDVAIGQPEVILGLIPGWGGTQRLPVLVGAAQAKRLILSGESIKAEQARLIGLVDEIVESEQDLEPLIAELLKKFQKAGPLAIAAAKRALRGEDEIKSFESCFQQDECREGMNAFLERRPPSWQQSE